jgi:SHS family lactate transporter-like MFS transporter
MGPPGVDDARIAWRREPTKNQWLAWLAGWLGWTLDAFDFTISLLLLVPINQEFKAPPDRGRADRHADPVDAPARRPLRRLDGRSTGPANALMLSITWYSLCQFIAGFSPTFSFPLVMRTLFGFGMGAEWPAGAALAMESWPERSRGLMSGVLQGSWNLGFLLTSIAY